MRPVYHKTDDRIKYHVFICMLAYYIMWHMKQRLKPLAESDGVGAGRKYSFDYVLECLKSIRKEDVRFMDADTRIVTVPNDEQERILNLLGVVVQPSPLSLETPSNLDGLWGFFVFWVGKLV